MLRLTEICDEPKALLFDLDGTLLDSVPDLAKAIDAALQALNFEAAGETLVRNWVGNGAILLCARALAWQQGVDENDVLEEELQAFHQLFLKHYQQISGQYSRLYDGVLPALSHWQQQGFKMALITNKPIQFVPHLLDQFQLSDFFDVVLGGDSLAEKKPSPMPLLHACDVLGVKPERAIMFGDSKTDILAAQNSGVKVIALTYGYNHGEPVASYQPDAVIDNLNQIQA